MLRFLLWYKCHRLFYICLYTTISLYKFCTQWGLSSLTSLSACNQVIIVWLKQPTCYCSYIGLEICLLKLPLSCLLNTTLITVLVWTFTCCEGSCIHWTCREHSTSTEPSLGDSETVVYTFLESIKCVLLMISIQPSLINIGPTCPPVVDVVLVYVAGSHTCQMYWSGRQHSCWEVLQTYSNRHNMWS